VSEPAYRLVRSARAPAAAPELDPAQRRVVDHAGGPLLVLAGPGTGKTTTLVESVVARAARGVPVDHMLMLTFSRRAAQEMRDRVAARLGCTIREPIARTVHSYAFGILRMANLGRSLPAPRLLAAAEQDLVIRELLPGRTATWPDALAPALSTDAFAGELRDFLMRAVERGLDGPALVALGRRNDRLDWVAAGQFLTEYHEVTALRDPGGYDPAELVRAALRALVDDPALLAIERARRRRLFVDEYQDTDPAQAELLALLAAGADELVLVGDPDQSIYAFRGADATAMREIPERFGDIDTLALTTSRRSGSALLAATRQIAERLPGPVDHRALAAVEGLAAGTVETAVFRSASEEAGYLAAVLRRAHLDGLPWNEMAVLVRSTVTALPTLQRALLTAGIPIATRPDDVPLADQPAVAALLHAVQCCLAAGRAEPGSAPFDEAAAEQLLLGPIGGADALLLRRVRRALRRGAAPGEPPTPLAALLVDPGDAALLPPPVRWAVQRCARVVAAGVAALADAGSPEDVLWAVWQASGLAQQWSASSRSGGTAGAAADRDLDAVVGLFDAAARYTDRLPHESAEGFARYLAGQQIPADPLSRPEPRGSGVSVLTAHASKGLEWQLVCIAGVQEGQWPDLRRRGSLLGSETLLDVLAGRDPRHLSLSAPRLAEERRLFYVAATRARSRLVVSAVSDDDNQPSRFLAELDPAGIDRPAPAPPRGVHLPGLVAELRAAVCDPDAPEPERDAAAAALARLAATGVSGADPDRWWGLAALSDDRPVLDADTAVAVSPSRVESFLRCELKSLLTQLGAENGDQLPAALGTLIHSVAARAPAGATREDLERLLDDEWASVDFGPRWYTANQRAKAGRMLARLAAWLHDSAEKGRQPVAVEQDFEADLGIARLRGRVDRIDRGSDGSLVVVDYKTGTSKPKSEDIAQHPQLAAYQLAVEEGAFGADERSGGAMLVQLGDGRTGYHEQHQAPLQDAEDPDWITTRIGYIAERMHGAEFTARANELCRNCELRACCPVYPEGRQVTQ
jgi:superfamily I DNA/RNA helicase/RecB family exonuclease